MKTCGQVSVDVPECEGFECYFDCPGHLIGCDKKILVEARFRKGPGRFCIIFDRPNGDASFYVPLPGPSCPAFSTAPNPWSDEYPGRPWNDEAEDALIEAQLERMNKRPTEFPWVGVYKSYP